MGLLNLLFVFLLVIKSLGQIIITQNERLDRSELFVAPDKNVTLKCNHNDGTYFYMFWYRQRSKGEMSLVAFSPGKDTEEIVAPFEKTKYKMKRPDIKESSLEIYSVVQEDLGIYFCASSRQGFGSSQAFFGDGTRLTVLDPLIPKSEPSVKILNAPQKESCKKKVTLVCWAEDFYPDHVKVAWFVGQQEITEDVATDPHATFVEGKKYTISSRLKVSQKMWKKSTNKFTCIVSYYNGSVTTEQSASVYGVAGGYDRDSYVKSSQWMKLAYGVTIAKSGLYGLVIFVFVWRKGSNEK